jgi:hypothetical protein
LYSLKAFETNLGRIETNNLGIIRLGTIGSRLHPLGMIGVKKTSLRSITNEGRSHTGKEAKARAWDNPIHKISMS